MFEGGLLNRTEYTMAGILSTSGRVEITIFAGPSCIVLVGELKYAFNQDSSDVLAQMLCEAYGITSYKIYLQNQEQIMRISKRVLGLHQSIASLSTSESGDFTLSILKPGHSLYAVHQPMFLLLAKKAVHHSLLVLKMVS